MDLYLLAARKSSFFSSPAAKESANLASSQRSRDIRTLTLNEGHEESIVRGG